MGSFHDSVVKQTTTALKNILEQHPKITPEKLEYILPVWYPIATVQLRMLENTFENFEVVQLTVLRLLGLGIRDPQLISDTMCLTPNYICKVLQLLTGYGYLDGQGLTALGARCLQEGKKILSVETAQEFQMDALGGLLLKVPQVVNNKAITERQKLDEKLPTLLPAEGIGLDALKQQLMNAKGQELYVHGGGVLHANVTDVLEVNCSALGFARAYALKFRGQPVPVVMAERFDRQVRDYVKRFSYQPFSVAVPAVAECWGFAPTTPVNNAHINDRMLQLHAEAVKPGGYAAADLLGEVLERMKGENE